MDPETIEASDMPWPVGFWPITFDRLTDGVNRRYFRGKRLMNGDDLGGYEYQTLDGKLSIIVWND